MHCSYFRSKIVILALIMLVVGQLSAVVIASVAWYDSDAISVKVSSPANNTYLGINNDLKLSAEAHDPDCANWGSSWYPYDDDVSSGENADNYHIWWTKTGEGVLNDFYGPSGAYTAPDYSAGNDVRTVTITAHADDFNRSDDAAGFDDGEGNNSIAVKVWQITLSNIQSDKEDQTYNGPYVPADIGGIELGFKAYGDTVEANSDNGIIKGVVGGFHLNTQIIGAIPSDNAIPTGNYVWKQWISSEVKYSDNGHDWAVFDVSNEQDDPTWCDGDSRNTKQSDNPDVNKIIMRDAPGIDTPLSPQDELYPRVGINFDSNFTTWVEYNGKTVSNKLSWTMKKEIARPSCKAPNNIWAIASYQDR